MKTSAGLACLLFCAAAMAVNADERAADPANEYEGSATAAPLDVRLFDLHDPGLTSTWPAFLATTPMLNGELLPISLQQRLMHTVQTYRSLTPVDEPAFFVATYFDLLSDRLMAAGAGPEILPLRVCPVFAGSTDAPVSQLLAAASGLPDDLFAYAPGQAQRYTYLFLQTEFSHCRFLATLRSNGGFASTRSGSRTGASAATLSFNVGTRQYAARVRSKDEVRALVETIGDSDAITAFRAQMSGSIPGDEAEVLCFVRLLALLATDGKNGYAAIPVLLPLLGGDEFADERNALSIADALELAYRARAAFRQIVPFEVRDVDGLLSAKLSVAHALAGERNYADDRIAALLTQFVDGSDLLLANLVVQEMVPLTRD